jgi:hypothetical protein
MTCFIRYGMSTEYRAPVLAPISMNIIKNGQLIGPGASAINGVLGVPVHVKYVHVINATRAPPKI